MRKLLTVILFTAWGVHAAGSCVVGTDAASWTSCEALKPGSFAAYGLFDMSAPSGAYTEAVTVSGSTGQSASDYTRLRAATGSERAVTITVGTATTITIHEGNTVIQDLIIENTYGSAVNAIAHPAGTNSIVQRCIIRTTGASSRAWAGHTAGGGHTVRSTIAYTTNAANSLEAIYSQAGTNAFQNLTLVGFNGGVSSYGGTANATNVAVKTRAAPSRNAFFASGGTVNQSYSASSDASASGAGSLTGVTNWTFANEAGGDFHIATSSALAGVGTNLSGTFTTDIDGQTITSWPIGADFPYVAPSSGICPPRCGPIRHGIGSGMGF